MKQIKQTQPVLSAEKKSGRRAYLKSLKVKHQNGFEGYLILTGARSRLTTLIKLNISPYTCQEIQDFNIILSLNDISLDVGEM